LFLPNSFCLIPCYFPVMSSLSRVTFQTYRNYISRSFYRTSSHKEICFINSAFATFVILWFSKSNVEKSRCQCRCTINSLFSRNGCSLFCRSPSSCPSPSPFSASKSAAGDITSITQRRHSSLFSSR
jgi:hypothetical protein